MEGRNGKRPVFEAELKKYPVLPHKKVTSLVNEGTKKATDKLIKHNLGLVMKIANKHQGHGIDFDDLVQEGVLGLMHALKKYSPAKGTLSTYASQWIAVYMQNAIMNNGSMVRTPIGVCKERRKIARLKSAYKEKHSRFPTDKELAENLGWPLKKLQKLYTSLSVWDEDQDINQVDMNGDPAHVVEVLDTAANVRDGIEDLPNKKLKQIIFDRHGFKSETKTLGQIAKKNNVSIENVRLKQKQAEITLRRRLADLS